MADLERVAHRRGRLELARASCGALGIGEVDDLDVVAAVDPRLRAVRLDEVGDVAGAAAAAGEAERQHRLDDGRGRGGDVDHVHDRAEVLRLAVVDDEQDVAAQVHVLVLEVGQRQRARRGAASRPSRCRGR